MFVSQSILSSFALLILSHYSHNKNSDTKVSFRTRRNANSSVQTILNCPPLFFFKKILKGRFKGRTCKRNYGSLNHRFAFFTIEMHPCRKLKAINRKRTQKFQTGIYHDTQELLEYQLDFHQYQTMAEKQFTIYF